MLRRCGTEEQREPWSSARCPCPSACWRRSRSGQAAGRCAVSGLRAGRGRARGPPPSALQPESSAPRSASAGSSSGSSSPDAPHHRPRRRSSGGHGHRGAHISGRDPRFDRRSPDARDQAFSLPRHARRPRLASCRARAAHDGKCPANSSVIATPPLCQDDINRMAALGFNSVRLPMSWSLLEPERGKFSEQYLDRVAQVVGWAREAGMYVILDMHQNAYSRYVGRSNPPPLPGGAAISLRYYTGAPSWATFTDRLPSESYEGQRELNPAVLEATTSFWYDRAGIQDEYIATVAHVMSRFKDDSTVAGISIYNEPLPGWNLSPGFEDLLLFPFYRRVIDAITGVRDGLLCPTGVFMPAPCGYRDLGVHDLRHLVFLDAGLLREVTDFPTHLGLPVSSYPNLVLGIHAYTHVYTIDHLIDQKTPPDKARYPWGGYDQSYYWGEREAHGIGAALFVTEFANDQ